MAADASRNPLGAERPGSDGRFRLWRDLASTGVVDTTTPGGILVLLKTYCSTACEGRLDQCRGTPQHATMKKQPILFSGPMVRAILTGTKTQTRRVVKGAWHEPGGYLQSEPGGEDDGTWYFSCRGVPASHVAECPYGRTGDRLLVKESAWMWCEKKPDGTTDQGRPKWCYLPHETAPVFYAADHPRKPCMALATPQTGNEWGWHFKTGRFLPLRASRITLEITGVRAERLNDIGEADALAEGARACAPGTHDDPRAPFRSLWESINGPGSWDANPWVWVVEFRRV